MLRCNESASSVFFHSQDEEPWRSSESDAQGGVHTADAASSGSPFSSSSSPFQDPLGESGPAAPQQDHTGNPPQTGAREGGGVWGRVGVGGCGWGRVGVCGSPGQ